MTPPLPPQLDRDHEADLIRAALTRQADRAPDPGPVLRALAARPQQARSRVGHLRPAVGVAAGLAAAAVVAGVTVAAGPGTGAAPAAPGASVGSAPATPPPTTRADALGAPLLYSPSWLPAGLREHQRRLDLNAASPVLHRTWVRRTPPGWQSPGALLGLTVHTGPVLAAAGSTTVDVGGVPGRLVGGAPGDDKILLEWQPRRGVWLLLVQAGLGLDRATVLRIASSMRPDDGAYRLPVELPAAQRGRLTTFDTVVDDRGGWRAELVLRGVTVRLGTRGEPDAPSDGQNVLVGGRTARYTVVRKDTVTAWLVVPLADGKVLTLTSLPQAPTPSGGGDGPTSGPTSSPTTQPTPSATRADGPVLSAAEMVAVAETVDTTAVPDIAWGG